MTYKQHITGISSVGGFKVETPRAQVGKARNFLRGGLPDFRQATLAKNAAMTACRGKARQTPSLIQQPPLLNTIPIQQETQHTIASPTNPKSTAPPPKKKHQEKSSSLGPQWYQWREKQNQYHLGLAHHRLQLPQMVRQSGGGEDHRYSVRSGAPFQLSSFSKISTSLDCCKG